MQTFSLRADYRQSMAGISLVLPPSIQNFYFHCNQLGDMDDANQDQAALSTLKAYRHVQRMFITYAIYYNSTTGTNPHMSYLKTLPDTAREQHRIQGHWVDRDHAPHISESWLLSVSIPTVPVSVSSENHDRWSRTFSKPCTASDKLNIENAFLSSKAAVVINNRTVFDQQLRKHFED